MDLKTLQGAMGVSLGGVFYTKIVSENFKRYKKSIFEDVKEFLRNDVVIIL